MSETNPAAEPAEPPQQAVVIERLYPADAAALWALWTTKEGFQSWWGPEGFRVEVHAIDPVPGGPLEYDMIADAPEAIAAMDAMGQPRAHATHGRYGIVEPHTRLSLIHMIDFIPGEAPYETTIEVTFQPAGDMTRMVVILHPHRTAHWTRMSLAGFTSQLAKLDARFAPPG